MYELNNIKSLYQKPITTPISKFPKTKNVFNLHLDYVYILDFSSK